MQKYTRQMMLLFATAPRCFSSSTFPSACGAAFPCRTRSLAPAELHALSGVHSIGQRGLLHCYKDTPHSRCLQFQGDRSLACFTYKFRDESENPTCRRMFLLHKPTVEKPSPASAADVSLRSSACAEHRIEPCQARKPRTRILIGRTQESTFPGQAEAGTHNYKKAATLRRIPADAEARLSPSSPPFRPCVQLSGA